HLSFLLHGQRLKGAWHLIRMRGNGKRENWLLLKQNDAEAQSRADSDFLDDLSFSVETGRSMMEIASGKSPALLRKSTEESREGLKRLMKAYSQVQLATLVDAPPEGMEW